MPQEVFRFHSRRAQRQKRVQTMQHLAVAAILLFEGVQHLRHGGEALHEVLPWLELAGGAFMIATVIREKLHHHQQGGVGWVEIGAGVLAFAETYSRNQQGRHHVSFLILSYAPAILFFALGFLDLERKRHYFAADDEGLSVRFRWRTRTWAWRDIASVQDTVNGLALLRRDGTVDDLDLRNVIEREDATAWLKRFVAERTAGLQTR